MDGHPFQICKKRWPLEGDLEGCEGEVWCILSHNLGHIRGGKKALLSLLVTIGLRKSSGSATCLELFFFLKNLTQNGKFGSQV